MDERLVDRVVRDGFVRVERAVAIEVVNACTSLLWQQIDAEPDDPRTWTRPVYWVGGMAQPPFAKAATAPVLLDALDSLVGPGRRQPRGDLGPFPLRFPDVEEPDDAGWHIEG